MSDPTVAIDLRGRQYYAFLGLTCIEAYNDWMVDEWCAGTNDRLIPLIIVLLLASMQGLEALTTKKVIGMAAAFAGVAVLAAEHGLSLHSATLRGDLITFIGSIGFIGSMGFIFSMLSSDFSSASLRAFFKLGSLRIDWI